MKEKNEASIKARKRALEKWKAKKNKNRPRKYEIVDQYGHFVGFITGTYDKAEVQQKAKAYGYKASGKWCYNAL